MSDKFVVTFFDDDRQTILDRQEVEQGTAITYQGKQPEKAAENGIEYVFVGWETTGNVMMVMENIDLFAKYEESSKATEKDADSMYILSEQNAEQAKLNEIMNAGQKVSQAEKATRNMTLEEKQSLVNEVKDKGSVNLDRETENERD